MRMDDAQSARKGPFDSPGQRPICVNLPTVHSQITPTALRNTAQGCRAAATLGQGDQPYSTLKGLRLTDSIPDIALIVGDPVRLEQFAELVLEVEPLMMLGLPRDVLFHLSAERLAHREGSISSLPLEAVK